MNWHIALEKFTTFVLWRSVSCFGSIFTYFWCIIKERTIQPFFNTPDVWNDESWASSKIKVSCGGCWDGRDGSIPCVGGWSQLRFRRCVTAIHLNPSLVTRREHPQSECWILMVQDISAMGGVEKAEEEDSRGKLMEEEEEVEELKVTPSGSLCGQGVKPCCSLHCCFLEYWKNIQVCHNVAQPSWRNHSIVADVCMSESYTRLILLLNQKCVRRRQSGPLIVRVNEYICLRPVCVHRQCFPLSAVEASPTSTVV